MKEKHKPIVEEGKKPPLVEFIEAFVKPVMKAYKRTEEKDIELL